MNRKFERPRGPAVPDGMKGETTSVDLGDAAFVQLRGSLLVK